jgi:GAF domain-containing protein
MPRAASCCARTILQPDVYVVPDLGDDERFASHPMLTGDPPLRFYAGVPLVTADGFALGALCVYDREPRDLDAGGREALRALARQVVTTLELHRLQIARRQQTEQVIRHQAALRDLACRDLSDWSSTTRAPSSSHPGISRHTTSPR